jgi:hypothetical protein
MVKPKQITINFGANDPHVDIAEKLQAQHPHHLVLMQAGTFLQAFNKSAWVLHTLKQYKLVLAGPATQPHLRAGLPVANYAKRLWPLVDEHNLSYLVANQSGVKFHDASVENIMLDTVSDEIVHEVIADLVSQKQLQTATAKKALVNPNTQDFLFKTKAAALDYQLLQDTLKLPRDIRTTWGENVRETMQSIMRNTYLYGLEDNKPQLLKQLSADVDLLKHYISQAQALNRFKIAFEHRVGLVVELGRILGGLQRAQKALR